MKSIFEIITILVFLLIITLFQKMDESYCDDTYRVRNTAHHVTLPPAGNSKIVVTASYKEGQGNIKPSNNQPHPARLHKG